MIEQTFFTDVKLITIIVSIIKNFILQRIGQTILNNRIMYAYVSMLY